MQSNSRIVSSGSKQVARKLGFCEAIENLFELFLKKQNDQRPAAKTPKRFYEIYNTPLMRSYLLATLSYFQSFLLVIESASQLKPKRLQLLHGQNDSVWHEYEQSRNKQKKKFGVFSEFYARLLLSCSLFEQTKSDELFFRCIFRFSLLFLKESLVLTAITLNQELAWKLVVQELSDILKGPTQRDAMNSMQYL